MLITLDILLSGCRMVCLHVLFGWILNNAYRFSTSFIKDCHFASAGFSSYFGKNWPYSQVPEFSHQTNFVCNGGTLFEKNNFSCHINLKRTISYFLLQLFFVGVMLFVG